MKMRSLTLAAITAATLAGAGVAHADVIENLDLTFVSGATFIGTIDLTNDFTAVNSVDGILTGYDGTVGPGYLGTGYSEAIDVVLPPDYGLSASTFFTQLTDSTYANWIDLGYSYDSSGITLSPGGDEPTPSLGLVGYNNIDYVDPLVAPTTSVPEPATLALLGFGLFGLGATRRRRTVNASNG
jgi:hypothetical protein